ncbi:hypothetical protein X801_02941 [Opisthorchis viverrini]|uniref:Sodium:neurotransmitter symporter family protein n=1 Tax=Opisthorchis viverrini TaxID=6198 RepID=A0A1S8X3A7_OPIVI|nr:hypothetical protein X801_02941 [Opisthorchis viverrini]
MGIPAHIYAKLFYLPTQKQPQWPVTCQIAAILLTGVFLFGGVKWIERANLVLVPILLIILIFTFGWSLTRPYSEVGIKFLFTPTWESFAQPGLWIAAASQNAFDTGAGLSVLFTYATYMGRSASITKYSLFIPIMNNLVSFAQPGLWIAAASQNAFDTGAGLSVLFTYATYMGRSASITKYSLFIPIMNNLVSLYASIAIFSTVFSTLIGEDGAITRSAILQIMQQSGPGSTGLTFTWIPVLFSNFGTLGRVLCALFFLCLIFAGLSSLLANIQVYILAAKEIGVPHRIAVTSSLLACFAVGLPSAIKLEILENQDNTWGYALIVSGLILTILVVAYNPLRFLRVVINGFGTSDWTVPVVWVAIITVVVPGICILLIVWWIYDYVRDTERWYDVTWTSATSTLIEWLVVLTAIVIINLVVVRVKRDLYVKTKRFGADPYDPETYTKESVVVGGNIWAVGDSNYSVRTL